jgi:hypothetical protein
MHSLVLIEDVNKGLILLFFIFLPSELCRMER